MEVKVQKPITADTPNKLIKLQEIKENPLDFERVDDEVVMNHLNLAFSPSNSPQVNSFYLQT